MQNTSSSSSPCYRRSPVAGGARKVCTDHVPELSLGNRGGLVVRVVNSRQASGTAAKQQVGSRRLSAVVASGRGHERVVVIWRASNTY